MASSTGYSLYCLSCTGDDCGEKIAGLLSWILLAKLHVDLFLSWYSLLLKRFICHESVFRALSSSCLLPVGRERVWLVAAKSQHTYW